MTESSPKSDIPLHPPSPAKPKPFYRRRPSLAILSFLLLLLLLGTVVLILSLTLFRPRDPRIQLVSATVTGVTPDLSLPTFSLSFNLTIALDILVYNPNRASFSHGHGTTRLFYHSHYIGDADVLPGHIPARGSTHVNISMTFDGSRLAAEAGNLISDGMAGEFVFDAETRIPGRVKFLGFITHHAVAVSQCHVTVGFPDLKVRRQDCIHKTKL